MKKKTRAVSTTFTNKKARHEYTIIDSFETGIVLTGTEIKSIRAGKINFKDSHAAIHKEEIFLYNCHINPYDCGGYANHDPLRRRKLLLHKKEIKKLIGKIQEKGLSLIPLKIYFKNGIAKLELATAKGKNLYDKRQSIKKKTENREMERALKDRN